MALIYYGLVSIIYITAIPILIYLSFKKKYSHSIPARFFLKDNPSFKNHDIWFHACSLGEVRSIEPIIDNLHDYQVDISVTTQTGYKRAKQIKNCTLRYLPFEIFLPFWVKKHRTLVVTEAELWPMLFWASKLKGAKNILINARVSDNSYSGYKKFSWFYKWIFSNIDEVFAQSEEDKKRLIELGAKSVHVEGNIKTFSKPDITKDYVKPDKKVIIVASSHEGEEEMILKNLKLIKDDILIVVPRHPERFGSVEKLLRKYSKVNSLYFGKISEDDSLNQDIILCNIMGELVNLYKISDIVILCGSFKEGIGGHNPLEPAYFNKKIISGPYVFNQKALFSLVENIKICSIDELKNIDFNEIKNSKILQTGEMKTLLEHITRK